MHDQPALIADAILEPPPAADAFAEGLAGVLRERFEATVHAVVQAPTGKRGRGAVPSIELQCRLPRRNAAGRFELTFRFRQVSQFHDRRYHAACCLIVHYFRQLAGFRIANHAIVTAFCKSLNDRTAAEIKAAIDAKAATLPANPEDRGAALRFVARPDNFVRNDVDRYLDQSPARQEAARRELLTDRESEYRKNFDERVARKQREYRELVGQRSYSPAPVAASAAALVEHHQQAAISVQDREAAAEQRRRDREAQQERERAELKARADADTNARFERLMPAHKERGLAHFGQGVNLADPEELVTVRRKILLALQFRSPPFKECSQ